MSAEDRGRAGPSARKPASRYSIFVGIAFLIVIVIATANTLQTRDDGILGATANEKGEPLPQFAVPELLGSQEGDANVSRTTARRGSNPCPTTSAPRPARSTSPDVIRVCDLFDRPLVISFWFTGGADCLPTQDLSTTLAQRFAGRVNFLSINVRDDRDEARAIADERGWRLPVGWDADGAVSNLYRVGGCPTVAFAYPGGLLSEAVIGSETLSEPELTAHRRAPGPRVRSARDGEPMNDRAASDAGAPEPGWVAAELREEFPGLALRQLGVDRGLGRSTRELKERLRVLSDRFSGGQAINLRHQPIPWAYRVFYRHIGLDPDEQRTPVEELALERMKHGGFRSHNLLDDALTIAIIESGVAVRAFDADRRRRRARHPARPSRARRSRAGPASFPAGTLVVADDERPAGAAVRRLGHRPGREPEDQAHDAGRDPGRRGARRSRSRRRCGWPPAGCDG